MKSFPVVQEGVPGSLLEGEIRLEHELGGGDVYSGRGGISIPGGGGYGGRVVGVTALP